MADAKTHDTAMLMECYATLVENSLATLDAGIVACVQAKFKQLIKWRDEPEIVGLDVAARPAPRRALVLEFSTPSVGKSRFRFMTIRSVGGSVTQAAKSIA